MISQFHTPMVVKPDEPLVAVHHQLATAGAATEVFIWNPPFIYIRCVRSIAGYPVTIEFGGGEYPTLPRNLVVGRVGVILVVGNPPSKATEKWPMTTYWLPEGDNMIAGISGGSRTTAMRIVILLEAAAAVAAGDGTPVAFDNGGDLPNRRSRSTRSEGPGHWPYNDTAELWKAIDKTLEGST